MPKNIKRKNLKMISGLAVATAIILFYKTFDEPKIKPKIAILIDDVTTQKQKEAILDIRYKINMSFLPPTSKHQNSAEISKDLEFSMLHLPLQASPKFKAFEENTLNVDNSYNTIEKRIKQLRDLYPQVKYTNNHTGSVFTSNKEAMNKLLKALQKYNFIFVDSKTIGNTVSKELVKKYNMPHIERNTPFLDNKKDLLYIKTQLKKAIKIAKEKGYAITIGHPNTETIKVLKDSKYLFKDIKLIYINELPINYLKS